MKRCTYCRAPISGEGTVCANCTHRQSPSPHSAHATLDGSSKVPTMQLGTGTPSGTTYLRGNRAWETATGGGFSYFPSGWG